jgi:hypothetical protein
MSRSTVSTVTRKSVDKAVKNLATLVERGANPAAIKYAELQVLENTGRISQTRITRSKITGRPADRNPNERSSKIPTEWMIQIDNESVWHRVYLAKWGWESLGTYYIIIDKTKWNVGLSGSRDVDLDFENFLYRIIT